MSGIDSDYVDKNRPFLDDIRRRRMIRYISECQKGAQACLELHDSIDAIEALIDASIRHDINRGERVTLALIIGFWALVWGKKDRWREFMRDVYPIIIQQKDPAQMSQYHRIISYIYELESVTDKAYEHARSAYEFSMMLSLDHIFVRKTGLARYAQIRTLKDENLEDLRDLLYRFWDEVRAHYKGVVKTNDIVLIVTHLINIERKLGKHERVLALYKDFYFDPDDLEVDADNKAEWFHNAGLTACWVEEDYAQAEEHLSQAVYFFQVSKSLVGEVGALCDWGLNAMQAGDLITAHNSIEASLELATKGSPLTQLAIIKGNMGLILALRGFHEEARSYLYDHLTISKALEMDAEYNRALANIAYLRFANGDYLLSQAEVHDVLESHQKISATGYGLTIALLGFTHYFCHEKSALKAIIEKFETWFITHDIKSLRLRIIGLRLRAYYEAMTKGGTYAHPYLDEAVALCSSEFMLGVLYLDKCRFSESTSRKEAWTLATSYLLEAGADGWFENNTIEDPPFILMT